MLKLHLPKSLPDMHNIQSFKFFLDSFDNNSYRMFKNQEFDIKYICVVLGGKKLNTRC